MNEYVTSESAAINAVWPLIEDIFNIHFLWRKCVIFLVIAGIADD